MNLNSKQFDCIVVGGGPAGSTFADIAAQNGLSVIVLEKDREIGVPVRYRWDAGPGKHLKK